MRTYSPAFPNTSDTYEKGINIRDYIAVHAMTGLLASHDPEAKIDPDRIASMSYAIADAMREESYG